MVHFQTSCSSCQMGLLSLSSQIKGQFIPFSSSMQPSRTPWPHASCQRNTHGPVCHVSFSCTGVTVRRVLLLQSAVSAHINHKLLRPGPRSHMPSVTPLSSPTHNTNLGTQKDPVSTRQWECLAGVTPGGTLEHKTRWELS